MSSEDPLADIFLAYCAFGGSAGAATREIDNVKFAKLVKEAKLLDRRITKTDADIIFSSSKAKGSRRLNYDQFLVALDKIGQRKYPSVDPDTAFAQIEEAIVAQGGPAVRGTRAATGGVYDKLLDTRLYTGSHRERFDDTGTGKGLAGRERVGKGGSLPAAGADGSMYVDKVSDLSQITRPNLAKAPKPKPVSRMRKPARSSANTPPPRAATGAPTPPTSTATPPPMPPSAAALRGAGTSTSTPPPPVPARLAPSPAPAPPAPPAAAAGVGGAVDSGIPPGSPYAPDVDPMDALEDIYCQFCEFGGAKGLREMDNVKFAKLAKDTKLVDKKCTRTDVDLVFSASKVKGSRRLNFDQFLLALQNLGKKKFPGNTPEDAFVLVRNVIIKHGGPKLARGTTSTATGGVYSKLLDHSLYTGAHRERFNARGQGRGKAGRTGHGAGSTVSDLSQITRPGL